MRAAFWMVLLFGVAAGLALLAGQNHGMVSLFWPPHRIDLSVNLAVLVLIVFVAVVHLALKAVAVLWSLPVQARQWRALRRERLAHAALREALALQMAGRFVRARKAAQNVLAHTRVSRAAVADSGEQALPGPDAVQLELLAHTLAAESAHALRDRTARDTHLAQALADVAGSGPVVEAAREGVRIRAARWALDDRDADQSLRLLQALPAGVQRRTLALRIRLKAARMARRSAEALDTVRMLARHGGLPEEAAATLSRSLAGELLRQAHDPQQLDRAWQSLEPDERSQPDTAIHAADRLLELQGSAGKALSWLWPVWDAVARGQLRLGDQSRGRLIRALERALDAHQAAGGAIDLQWLGSIEAAQRAQPADAMLQYLAGVACLHRELWGKAHQLLTQSVLSLQDRGLRRRAWRALAELAEQRGDPAAAAEAWRQAAQD